MNRISKRRSTKMLFSALGAILVLCALLALILSVPNFLNRPEQHLIEDKPVFTITHAPGPVTSVGYSPDGALLAYSTAEGTIHLWNIAGMREVSTLTPGDHGSNAIPTLYSVVFSPDGKMLAAGSADGSLHMWSTPDGKLLRTLSGHTGPAWSVQFSSSGKWLISGSRDGTIRIWDVASGTLKTSIDGDMGWINSAKLSPDEKRLTAAGEHDTVRQWLMSKIDEQDAEGTGRGIYFAYDLSGSPFPTSTPTGAVASTTRQAQARPTPAGTTRLGRPIEAVEYSPNGRWLVGVSYYLAGGGAKLWQMPGPELHPDSAPSNAGNIPEKSLSGPGLVERTSLHITDILAFSPDSTILAINDDNLIWLIRVDTRDIVVGLQKHTQHVTGLAFSPDGKTLASSSEDGTVSIWQVPTP